MTLKNPLPLLLPIVLIIVIGISNLKLRESRRDMRPAPPLADLGDVPATLTLIQVGLGGFRGLLVDLLWLRASILKERNQFVELVQLSGWITKLDPHAAEAWSYHAWNMAYNVSIMLRRPEDRWRWVRHGIRLLRDEGLRYNPSEASLYYDLGWLFQHKLGSDHDRAHRYYKGTLAERMSPWLTPTGGVSDEKNTQAAQALKEHFKMRVEIMREIETRLAPLDWRLPESHALYWAWLGLKLNDPRHNLSLRRMIYQNLTRAVTAGRLVEFDADGKTWVTTPNPALIPGTCTFFEESIERYPNRGLEGPYIRFLGLAIHRTRESNRTPLAREMYAKLVRECTRRRMPPPAFETVAAGDFSHPVFTVEP